MDASDLECIAKFFLKVLLQKLVVIVPTTLL